MRMPTIERRRPSNRRIVLIALAVVLVVLLVSLRGIAGFYTDYLWFKELGYTDVWRELLMAKALPTAVFTVVFFLLILGNLIIADRLQPRFRPAGPEEELVERYRQFIGPYAGRVRVAVAVFLAIVAASGLTSQWNSWLLFRHRVPFGGPGDPQFGADIGFYVFTLPFLRFIFEWTFAALVIVLLVTAVAHYLNGGIRVQGPFQRVTPQVKAHLSVILGVMALLKAFGYWLQRFELNFSSRGAVDGAGYTDVKAELPALNMLIVISVAAALLFFVNRWLKGWVLPIIAVGLWSFVSVIIGGIYPTVIQKVSVEPNELQKETKYIERNIAATRAAFGLDKVVVKDFGYREDIDAETIRANERVIDDLRLWDPDVANTHYTQSQQVRPQYTFGDVDIDRYEIDGRTRQVVLSARELSLGRLPSQTWQNRHLVYTHGYGLVAAQSNKATATGSPEFLVKDIPPVSTELEVTQPAIYYGEELPGYAFVKTTQKEFDFPREPQDASTTYAGKGGVRVNNLLRRVALFLRFGDPKVLISSQITSESKALYLRDINDRVRKAAPFLKFDADPYPVLLDGRILWVIDAYTVSDRYPYSQSYSPGARRLADSSGLQTRLNYVRNSVKATVDAYDGTVKFYVYDDLANPDPIIKAYRKAFPKLFTDREQMPEGLVNHLRYPEDLFKVQSDQFADYHVTDAPTFYQNSRQWAVAQDPGGAGRLAANPATTPTSAAAHAAGGYVMVTRGLLALLDDEAELAAALSHEVGHVVQRHASQRARQRQSVLDAAVEAATSTGSITVGRSVARDGLLALRRYSREQELEADKIGVAMLVKAGYRGGAMASLIDKLRRQGQLELQLMGEAPDSIDRRSTSSTHPAPVERRIALQGVDDASTPGESNRAAFLDAINGMSVDDPPQEGFVRGNRFLHPVLRLAFEAPRDFRLFNDTDGLLGVGRDRSLLFFSCTDGPAQGSLADWMRNRLKPTPTDIQTIVIGGAEAAIGARPRGSDTGLGQARYVLIRHGDRVCFFNLLSDGPDRDQRIEVLVSAARTFRSLSDAEASSLRPYRLRIVPTAGTTAAQLARRLPYADYKMERLLLLNSVDNGAELLRLPQVKVIEP